MKEPNQPSVNFISIFFLGDTLTVGDDTIDCNNQIWPANILEIASLLFISKRIYATIATTFQLNDHLGTQWRPLFYAMDEVTLISIFGSSLVLHLPHREDI